MTQIPSYSFSNKSRQLPFIPSQNKQDALPKLQLSCKDPTNGPPPYAGMQLMVKRPPIGSQIPTGSAVPHKPPSAAPASSDVSSKHFMKMPKEIKSGSTPKVPSKY